MAGSIVFTETPDRRIQRVKFAWTATAGGAVSAIKTERSYDGLIRAVIFADGSPAPTTLYDVEIRDSDGLDLLKGQGANLTVPGPTIVFETGVLFYPCWGTTLELFITNAGNLGQGTITLWVKGT
jgi:hypothetical protein